MAPCRRLTRPSTRRRGGRAPRRAAGAGARAARRGRTSRCARRRRATTTPVAATPTRPARPMSFQGTAHGAVGYGRWSAATRPVSSTTPSPSRRPATSGCSAAVVRRPRDPHASRTARSTTSGWSSRSTTCRRCCGTPSSAGRCPTCGPGERQRGVQLHLLRDAVVTWRERYGQRAWMRQLEGDDRARARGPADGGHRPLRRPPVPDDRRPRAPVGERPRARKASSLETIYCAELVATTYQPMGLLPDAARPASWYDPGRFWSGDRLGLVRALRARRRDRGRLKATGPAFDSRRARARVASSLLLVPVPREPHASPRRGRAVRGRAACTAASRSPARRSEQLDLIGDVASVTTSLCIEGGSTYNRRLGRARAGVNDDVGRAQLLIAYRVPDGRGRSRRPTAARAAATSLRGRARGATDPPATAARWVASAGEAHDFGVARGQRRP